MATTKRMCCVIGCPLENTDGVLLRFPPRDSTRYQHWMMMYPNTFVLNDKGENFICHRHFSSNPVGRKGNLKPHIRPTKYLNTDRAQEQVLETFLIKVVYEWSLRNSNSDSGGIAAAAVEVSRILGMPSFRTTSDWLRKFQQIREVNMKNGLRFVGDLASGRAVSDIVKDLRKYLPSSFIIPMDVLDVTGTGEPTVKNECLSDDEADSVDVYLEVNSDTDQNEVAKAKVESSDDMSEEETAPTSSKEDEKPLDTYKDAYALLKPLEMYILQKGNSAALARLREIATVVREGIETESKPRSGATRAGVA